MRNYPKSSITDKGYRSRDNLKLKSEVISTIFMGLSSDVSEDMKDYCIKARSATEGFIAVAKNLRGFNRSLYRGFKGNRIWTLLSQCAYNLKKLLQLYYIEEIPEEVLIKLNLLE